MRREREIGDCGIENGVSLYIYTTMCLRERERGAVKDVTLVGHVYSENNNYH